jgi:GMP synthase PP-ATPase subunit
MTTGLRSTKLKSKKLEASEQFIDAVKGIKRRNRHLRKKIKREVQNIFQTEMMRSFSRQVDDQIIKELTNAKDDEKI